MVGVCAAMTCRDERDALHCEGRGANKLQALCALHFMCLGGLSREEALALCVLISNAQLGICTKLG